MSQTTSAIPGGSPQDPKKPAGAAPTTPSAQGPRPGAHQPTVARPMPINKPPVVTVKPGAPGAPVAKPGATQIPANRPAAVPGAAPKAAALGTPGASAAPGVAKPGAAAPSAASAPAESASPQIAELKGRPIGRVLTKMG